MSERKPDRMLPWTWVPSLYFAEGIPYVVVMTVAVVLYKRMGISNTDIALYTSWLYLPWVIKPLWSPFVDLLRTKRFWIVTTQLLLGAGLAGIALTIPAPDFFRYTLAVFWLMAFSSATHDIAADGFYMLGLDEHQQAFFVGWRSTAYRAAMLFGQGVLVMLAGHLEQTTGLEPVRVEVAARSAVAAELPTLIDDAGFPAPEPGDLRIVVSTGGLEVGVGRHDSKAVFALKKLMAESNRERGLVEAGPEEVAEKKSEDASWWKRNVSGPLAGFLRERFGPAEAVKKPDAMAGSLGLVRLRLSKPPDPGEEVVVHVGRESGDASITLVEGSRLRFTAENWNQPALVAFEVDYRLRRDTETIFEARSGNVPLAWSITFMVLAGLFLALFVYHRFVLPRPASDVPAVHGAGRGIIGEFGLTFALFFRRKGIWMILAFLLLYRLGEAQLVKLASPFLLDPREVGGLGLTTGEVGFVYGTVGMLALTAGGIIGGFAAAQKGLRFWLMWMVVAINLPNAVYIYLSYAQPESLFIVNLCVGIEQFGYGFGFTAYMLYMIYASRGEHKTAHYAICTGFMALGMMIPGMFSGWLQEAIGYQHFFVWVLIATIPGFIVAALVKIDPTFGQKDIRSQGKIRH